MLAGLFLPLQLPLENHIFIDIYTEVSKHIIFFNSHFILFSLHLLVTIPKPNYVLFLGNKNTWTCWGNHDLDSWVVATAGSTARSIWQIILYPWFNLYPTAYLVTDNPPPYEHEASFGFSVESFI